jgi:hypothetical protein
MNDVVGLNMRGTLAIIADSMATETQTGKQRIEFFKTGVLFPGCAYGISGAMI